MYWMFVYSPNSYVESDAIQWGGLQEVISLDEVIRMDSLMMELVSL